MVGGGCMHKHPSPFCPPSLTFTSRQLARGKRPASARCCLLRRRRATPGVCRTYSVCWACLRCTGRWPGGTTPVCRCCWSLTPTPHSSHGEEGGGDRRGPEGREGKEAGMPPTPCCFNLPRLVSTPAFPALCRPSGPSPLSWAWCWSQAPRPCTQVSPHSPGLLSCWLHAGLSSSPNYWGNPGPHH